MSRLLADPADYDSDLDDERAEYEQSLMDDEAAERDPWEDDEEPHPGFGFPIPPPSETEAALMAADELVEALEPTDYEQSLMDDEAAERDPWEDDEEPHPGFGFPIPPPSETEAALMAADELVEALEPTDYEPAPLRLVETWPPAERAALARRLERIAPGVSLTELSDAREAVGLPRLSESTSIERRYAPLWLLGARGRAALATVRAERARLSVGMAPSRAARMRLGELRARAAGGGR